MKDEEWLEDRWTNREIPSRGFCGVVIMASILFWVVLTLVVVSLVQHLPN